VICVKAYIHDPCQTVDHLARLEMLICIDVLSMIFMSKRLLYPPTFLKPFCFRGIGRWISRLPKCCRFGQWWKEVPLRNVSCDRWWSKRPCRCFVPSTIEGLFGIESDVWNSVQTMENESGVMPDIVGEDFHLQESVMDQEYRSRSRSDYRGIMVGKDHGSPIEEIHDPSCSI
jgi:hypothetical protein